MAELEDDLAAIAEAMDGYTPPSVEVREPAYLRAKFLLEEAEDLVRQAGTWGLGGAQVLADVGRGWAALALVESVPEERRWHLAVPDGECPGECASAVQVILPADWQAAVEVGASIPIVGCGNPWHYVFPTLQSQG